MKFRYKRVTYTSLKSSQGKQRDESKVSCPLAISSAYGSVGVVASNNEVTGIFNFNSISSRLKESFTYVNH